jgi:hypothetical protein
MLMRLHSLPGPFSFLAPFYRDIILVPMQYFTPKSGLYSYQGCFWKSICSPERIFPGHINCRVSGCTCDVTLYSSNVFFTKDLITEKNLPNVNTMLPEIVRTHPIICNKKINDCFYGVIFI